jgi:hypothetical protein
MNQRSKISRAEHLTVNGDPLVNIRLKKADKKKKKKKKENNATVKRNLICLIKQPKGYEYSYRNMQNITSN